MQGKLVEGGLSAAPHHSLGLFCAFFRALFLLLIPPSSPFATKTQLDPTTTMSKYRPLFELHQLVQLTHSSTDKAIFYSQVHLSFDDTVDEDEAGGWVLSTFTGKTYFEREYRREDLDSLVSFLSDGHPLFAWNVQVPFCFLAY